MIGMEIVVLVGIRELVGTCVGVLIEICFVKINRVDLI